MKLSILICTIPERKDKFTALHKHILSMCAHGSVQVIYDDRVKSEVSVGQKRQDLLSKAIGDYVVFIDDDDNVPPYYVSEILKAIEHAPDCIGFRIECDMEGKKESACASMKYDWQDNVDGFRYVRSIYHKTPVKRSIALKVGFRDKRFGEDYEFSMGIKPLLKKEIFIDKVMYFYNYKYENPKSKYGL